MRVPNVDEGVLGDAEVEQFGHDSARAVDVQEDVVRLNVAVDDTRRVHARERGHHRQQQRERLLDLQLAACIEFGLQASGRAAAPSRGRARRVVLAEVEHVDHVRIAKLRGQPHLLQEARDAALVDAVVGLQELDRDRPAGPQVARLEQRRSSRPGEQPLDAIAALRCRSRCAPAGSGLALRLPSTESIRRWARRGFFHRSPQRLPSTHLRSISLPLGMHDAIPENSALRHRLHSDYYALPMYLGRYRFASSHR